MGSEELSEEASSDDRLPLIRSDRAASVRRLGRNVRHSVCMIMYCICSRIRSLFHWLPEPFTFMIKAFAQKDKVALVKLPQ